MNYEIIEENVSQERLDEREIHWISHFNSLAPSGYNCNSGGSAQHNLSREIRDKVRYSINKAKIDRDGYMGDVQETGNMFYPRTRQNGKKHFLSNGGFRTKQEAIEVLKTYTKDPESFMKVDGTHQRQVGCVSKKHSKWVVEYKRNYLGSYDTEEKAREVLKEYVEVLQSS